MANWGDLEISIAAALIAVAIVGGLQWWIRTRPDYDGKNNGWGGTVVAFVVVFLLAGVGLNNAVDEAVLEAERESWLTTVTTRDTVDAGCVHDLMYGDGMSLDEAIWHCEEFEDEAEYKADLYDDPGY